MVKVHHLSVVVDTESEEYKKGKKVGKDLSDVACDKLNEKLEELGESVKILSVKPYFDRHMPIYSKGENKWYSKSICTLSVFVTTE